MSETNGADKRPVSSAEKETFSSGGKRHMILLRGAWGSKIDLLILRLTGYSLVTKQYAMALGVPYAPTLLLTTTGARSGKKRTCGLPYFRVGSDLIVRGTHGGGSTDPHWVHNVRKHEDVRIRVRRHAYNVKAQVTTGEERKRVFEALDEYGDNTRRYQEMAAPREIPLVALRGAADLIRR
jgi:deazaflavin-dependent oxidoreductase (nitroreductase family)